MKIPEQYLPVMPYLIVKDAKALSDFAKAVFNATEQLMVPTDDGKVRHGELRISDAVIMFADAGEAWKEIPAAMFLYVEDVNDVYVKALKNGAGSLHPPVQRDYGYTAGFEDTNGNQWFIVEGQKGSE